jgi:hypothetical protein
VLVTSGTAIVPRCPSTKTIPKGAKSQCKSLSEVRAGQVGDYDELVYVAFGLVVVRTCALLESRSWRIGKSRKAGRYSGTVKSQADIRLDARSCSLFLGLQAPPRAEAGKGAGSEGSKWRVNHQPRTAFGLDDTRHRHQWQSQGSPTFGHDDRQ